MIVWCGRCDTNPVDLAGLVGPTALDWFGHTAGRPWCPVCLLAAMLIPPMLEALGL